MSVVAVLRQSYYLVVDLQSKAAYSGPVLVSFYSNCLLIVAMHCEAFPNGRPALLSLHLALQIKTMTAFGKQGVRSCKASCAALPNEDVRMLEQI